MLNTKNILCESIFAYKACSYRLVFYNEKTTHFVLFDVDRSEGLRYAFPVKHSLMQVFSGPAGLYLLADKYVVYSLRYVNQQFRPVLLNNTLFKVRTPTKALSWNFHYGDTSFGLMATLFNAKSERYSYAVFHCVHDTLVRSATVTQALPSLVPFERIFVNRFFFVGVAARGACRNLESFQLDYSVIKERGVSPRMLSHGSAGVVTVKNVLPSKGGNNRSHPVQLKNPVLIPEGSAFVDFEDSIYLLRPDDAHCLVFGKEDTPESEELTYEMVCKTLKLPRALTADELRGAWDHNDRLYLTSEARLYLNISNLALVEASREEMERDRIMYNITCSVTTQNDEPSVTSPGVNSPRITAASSRLTRSMLTSNGRVGMSPRDHAIYVK